MSEDDRYDLHELSDLSGVSARTIRYYTQLGLLPSPGSGPGVRYGRGHLDRLRLVRILQSQHLPLHVIADTLAGLDDEAVRASLADAEKQPPPPTNSAAEYIQAVLTREPITTPYASSKHPTVTPRFALVKAESPTLSSRRENWERIAITPDIELHVRRPLSREMNRRIERLLAAARQILTDQPSGGEES